MSRHLIFGYGRGYEGRDGCRCRPDTLLAPKVGEVPRARAAELLRVRHLRDPLDQDGLRLQHLLRRATAMTRFRVRIVCWLYGWSACLGRCGRGDRDWHVRHYGPDWWHQRNPHPLILAGWRWRRWLRVHEADHPARRKKAGRCPE